MLQTMRPPGFRGIFRDDDLARAVYSESAGIARAMPVAVAVPADEDDAVVLVRWAHDTGTPLIPRGSGSSMAGAAVGAGVIADLSRLDEIGTVDMASRHLRVGPGALRDAVDTRASSHALRFPVDPSSGPFCTIGGMVATNAAGARSLRFGATRLWIEALDCVFDDGSRAVIRRGGAPPATVPAIARFVRDVLPELPAEPPSHRGVLKESSGYALADLARNGDLLDLLVGSEGTLALFVGVELRLAERPGATSSILAAFPSIERAVEASQTARAAGASACELLDRTFLEIALSGGTPVPVPPSSDAVILAEVEGATPEDASAMADTVAEACRAAGASDVRVALTEEDEERLWTLRHAASPVLARLDPALASMQFIEDGAVPPERLPEYVRGVRAALSARGIRGVIFGHAGDAHIHVNPLVDTRAPDWRRRIEGLLDDVAALTARLGGTLAGEHGDGRLRTPLLDRVWPPAALDLFRAVKDAFDPQRIFNPGVKIASPGARPIESVKYDPTLAPLPPEARRALDEIARDRAYARFRLSLVPERN
jgi:FAD/FMN-containing dehydrogenase